MMNVKKLLLPLAMSIASQCWSQVSLQNSNKSSLHFVENKGQITDQYYQPRTDIDFRIGGNGVNLFVGNGTMHFQWANPIGSKVVNEDTLQEIATYRMDVQLLGANPNATVITEKPLPFYERYYTPQFDAEGGVAASYERITYQNIYPNIDWTLYVKNNQVEYDFVVHPGGKVADIQLQYSGTSALSINKDGSLSATTPFGRVTEAAPYSFQQADGKVVSSAFKLQNNVLSFDVGNYEGTLVIDPVLEWSTYYGGSFDETIPIGCVTADAFGNAYFTGHTTSTQNIATTGSHQDTLRANNDMFLVKFNTLGQRLWATYYGGSSADQSNAVATDRIGNVYLAGQTSSNSTVNPNMSTPGAHQPTWGGNQDALLVKFDSSGARQWATYYGGTGADLAFGLACDTANNIIMSGLSASTAGIATTGVHQENRAGGNDAFVVKFDPQGQRLWGSYFGGTSAEFAPAVAVDDSNNIIIAGYTQSNNGIANAAAYQSAISGIRDAFIAKFNSSGAYLWSTYFGADGAERLQAVSSDDAGNIYIAGDTEPGSNSLSIGNSHQTTYAGGASDGFVSKFTAGGQIVWSTYAGGSTIDRLTAIKYHPDGFVYTTGLSNSVSNMVYGNALQPVYGGGQDGIIQKYDTAGNLIWSTYYGGEGADHATGIAFGPPGTIFIGGMTASASGIATLNAHQMTHGGSMNDGFIALINDCDLENHNSISGADTVCQNMIYTYHTATVAGAQAYQWILPQGWQGASNTNSIDITAHGANDSIGLAIVFACGVSDTVYKSIMVIALPELNPTGAVGLCAVDTLVISASAANDYQWLQNGQVLVGATQQTLSVYDAGTYQVASTNALGCADTSMATTVSINPQPEPLISVSGNTLSTGVFTSYQWQHNGVNITGATQQHYTFSINSGAYTVLVTDTNGCSASSLPFTAGVGIRPSALDMSSIKIYPNPVTNLLHVESDTPLLLQLSSIDGRVLLQSNTSSLDLSAMNAGVYILYCYDAQGGFVGVKKVVKR